MIPRPGVVFGPVTAWLVALGVCGAAAADRAELFRAAEERQAAGDAEGVYAAAERARGAGEPVSLADLRSRILDTDQVLLEYFVGPDATLIVLVSQDRCRSARIPVGADSLGGLANAMVSGLRAGEAVPSAARALHDLLIGPLAEETPPQSRLVLSPDGPLEGVPFAALHDGRTFLVERHPLSSTPSATSLTTAPRGGSIVTLPLGDEASAAPPPSLAADLPRDVAMQRAQCAAIAKGMPPREWAAHVATGRMRAPRRASGEFPGWIVPIGMALGAGILALALRRVPRAADSR